MPNTLFQPFQLGDLTLTNRMVMAPMTRNRAGADGIVPSMMVDYYQQRASAGLIITESVPVSAAAIGYPCTPGIYTNEQVASWRHVTQAVQAAGGHIFVQLQHCGRISHPSLLPGNTIPIAPSALRPEGQAVTYHGMQDFVLPREIGSHELPGVVAQFKRAAESARDAGFDGIEVHGANGYLIDQFLRDGSNRRANDAYGGNVKNRMRLLNEILDAVCSVWPSQRVGIRLSPENRFNSMSDSEPQAHFEYIIGELAQRGLAYLHVLEGDMMTKTSVLDYRALRTQATCPYIANNGYDLSRAQAAISSGAADLIAFGVPFLANPDLVYRLREKLPLNEVDPTTFYRGGESGYTDYPFVEAARK